MSKTHFARKMDLKIWNLDLLQLYHSEEEESNSEMENALMNMELSKTTIELFLA